MQDQVFDGMGRVPLQAQSHGRFSVFEDLGLCRTQSVGVRRIGCRAGGQQFGERAVAAKPPPNHINRLFQLVELNRLVRELGHQGNQIPCRLEIERGFPHGARHCAHGVDRLGELVLLDQIQCGHHIRQPLQTRVAIIAV